MVLEAFPVIVVQVMELGVHEIFTVFSNVIEVRRRKWCSAWEVHRAVALVELLTKRVRQHRPVTIQNAGSLSATARIHCSSRRARLPMATFSRTPRRLGNN